MGKQINRREVRDWSGIYGGRQEEGFGNVILRPGQAAKEARATITSCHFQVQGMPLQRAIIRTIYIALACSKYHRFRPAVAQTLLTTLKSV